MKSITIKISWIAGVFLVATFILTSGSPLYRLISMIDTFIYFLYLNLAFILGILGFIFFLKYKLYVLNALPNFLTKNILVETISEQVKEVAIDKANEHGKDKFSGIYNKGSQFLEKFSALKYLKSFSVYLIALITAHYLVGNYFIEGIIINAQIGSLLLLNIIFIGYYLYQGNKKVI